MPESGRLVRLVHPCSILQHSQPSVPTAASLFRHDFGKFRVLTVRSPRGLESLLRIIREPLWHGRWPTAVFVMDAVSGLPTQVVILEFSSYVRASQISLDSPQPSGNMLSNKPAVRGLMDGDDDDASEEGEIGAGITVKLVDDSPFDSQNRSEHLQRGAAGRHTENMTVHKIC